MIMACMPALKPLLHSYAWLVPTSTRRSTSPRFGNDRSLKLFGTPGLRARVARDETSRDYRDATGIVEIRRRSCTLMVITIIYRVPSGSRGTTSRRSRNFSLEELQPVVFGFASLRSPASACMPQMGRHATHMRPLQTLAAELCNAIHLSGSGPSTHARMQIERSKSSLKAPDRFTVASVHTLRRLHAHEF